MTGRSLPAEAQQPCSPLVAGAVTAIVPTLADRPRHASLLRAIGSLRDAALDTPLTVTAVVNGHRYAPEVLADLTKASVNVVRIEEASLPAALRAGRRSVQTAFFCFLDDDDEYLPAAIDRRMQALAGAPECALVATNGFRHDGHDDRRALDFLASVPTDPLAALFDENWLPSCGALFRSEAVGAEFFDDPHAYLEWTWLAFRLASSGRRVAVLDEPTFRIHDSPSSLSKSPAYIASHASLYRRMLELPVPLNVRRTIEQRLAIALSRTSLHHLERDELSAAWRCHVATLRTPGGWRYCSQTLRLVAASLRRCLTAHQAR
jgi:hypothetical protein